MSSVNKLAPLLHELKARQLGTLLKSIGANTTGRKSDLVARCVSELSRESHGPTQRPTRVLSIDMGVKNLAFCLCEVDLPKARPDPPSTKTRADASPRIDVRTWKCMSLLGEDSAQATEASRAEDIYHPRNMSRLALNLVQSEWLPLNPSRILIERQRFRTSRSPQIQEWTVRVNMLESMLYAIFAAAAQADADRGISGEHRRLGSVEGVSPARVATFWSDSDAGDQGTERPKGPANARAVKKEKIDLVRKWVQEPGSAPFNLSFDGAAEQIRRTFAMGRTRGQKRRAASDEQSESAQPAKLDDLADCLLQAAAWVQWEANRRLVTHANVNKLQDLELLLARLQHGKLDSG